MLRDETERLSNEQSLQEARENLQQALWSADIGWGVVDLVSGAFEPDARARAILGLTPEEPLTVDTLLALIYPDDVPLLLADLARLLESRVVAPLEYRIVRRDGHVRTIRGTGLLRYDAGGQPRNQVPRPGVVPAPVPGDEPLAAVRGADPGSEGRDDPGDCGDETKKPCAP